MSLPRITVITPSYNQGSYLKATIESVLSQNYPNLEYFVIDGGSNDDSVAVIQQYAPQLSWWVSEKDQGQSHAINKGFERATGDIVTWINSDDLLAPGSLLAAAEHYLQTGSPWMAGQVDEIDEHGRHVSNLPVDIPATAADWLNLLVRGVSYSFNQPGTFFPNPVKSGVGLLDQGLHYSFDHEFLLRVLHQFGKPYVSADRTASFRVHSASKTSTSQGHFRRENRRIALRHLGMAPLLKRLRLLLVYGVTAWRG